MNISEFLDWIAKTVYNKYPFNKNCIIEQILGS